jgi:AhpD family alkylhydroperoxidase
VSPIELRPNGRYPWHIRLILFLQRRNYGRELEPTRLWGRLGPVFLAMSLMYRALERKRSPIESALRAQLRVRVSQINWCAFCVDLNSALSIKHHVSQEKLLALPEFETSELFTERERAALCYAETMTYTGRSVSPMLTARLKRHFSDDAIIELTALIAYQNMSSKFNAALGVAPQGFCSLPARNVDAEASHYQ